jgi:hypothetical protein
VGPRASLDAVAKSLLASWELNSGCQACSLVTILTELTWLQVKPEVLLYTMSNVYCDVNTVIFLICIYMDNIKVKLSHYTPWRCLGEKGYSSNSFLTSAPDEGEWSAL